MLMIKANIENDTKLTTARFISSLNGEIADVVDLQHYVEIEDLVSMTMKVDKQQKQRGQHKHFRIPTQNGVQSGKNMMKRREIGPLSLFFSLITFFNLSTRTPTRRLLKFNLVKVNFLG